VELNSDGRLTETDISEMAEAFHDLHERMFSYSVRESSVDLFHWRVHATRTVKSAETPVLPETGATVDKAQKGNRRVYFSDINEYRDTDIYDGDALERGMIVKGPAVVEQKNTTVVVFPGQKLEVNEYGDFVLAL